MVRYVKQQDETGCGPVAIINTFKWMGCPVTYKFIHVARRLCSWQDGRSFDGGTTDQNLEKALKKLGIKKKRKICPTLGEIDNHIDLGGAVLIGYLNPYFVSGFMKKNEGHFTLCIGRSKSSYTLINDLNKTIAKRNRATIKNMLQRVVDGRKCWCWFITK